MDSISTATTAGPSTTLTSGWGYLVFSPVGEAPSAVLYTDLQVEVEENDHFPIARLEEGVFDIVVQDIHLVSSHRREPES